LGLGSGSRPFKALQNFTRLAWGAGNHQRLGGALFIDHNDKGLAGVPVLAHFRKGQLGAARGERRLGHEDPITTGFHACPTDRSAIGKYFDLRARRAAACYDHGAVRFGPKQAKGRGNNGISGSGSTAHRRGHVYNRFGRRRRCSFSVRSGGYRHGLGRCGRGLRIGSRDWSRSHAGTGHLAAQTLAHAIAAVEALDQRRAGQDADNNDERDRCGSNGEREGLVRSGVGQFVLQDD
jgi:hypothetical protein